MTGSNAARFERAPALGAARAVAAQALAPGEGVEKTRNLR